MTYLLATTTNNVNKSLRQRCSRGTERGWEPAIVAQVEVLARSTIVKETKAGEGKGPALVKDKRGFARRPSEVLELLASKICRAQDGRRAHRRSEVRLALPPLTEPLVRSTKNVHLLPFSALY